ncbi:MAG: 50S ribosomal protein L4, partial [Gemmatimonadetes bacterium]|nr:50S ribosomal protein L4 [Gemmatimonadota bacterium]
QAVVAQLANRRQGTQDTISRSESGYSTAKLRIQKHTGRARLGSRTSHLLGGSVSHGPHPRSYRQRLPAKMRRQALRVALSAKVRDERLLILDALELDEPRTKRVKQLLSNLGFEGTTLVVTDARNEALLKSVRNLGDVEAVLAEQVNVAETTRVRNMVVTRDAARLIDERVGAPVRKPASGAKAK